ncbi:MAG TPA: hypothetical protein DIT18_15190 [Pseudomonas sp.]|nr:hypothetical protein [Pseudomonas sp.]
MSGSISGVSRATMRGCWSNSGACRQASTRPRPGRK